jgi:hypothetical protein
MNRGTFVIPLGYIGLGDAFDQVFTELEDKEALDEGLSRRVPLVRSQPAADGISQSVDEAQGAVAVQSESKPSLVVEVGLDQEAVNADESARARVEFLLRTALSEGHLKAFTYSPDGRTWGEIPDRSQWHRMSFAFPGLETFIDPVLSPGPDVNGSPVFLEETKFKKWLKEQVAERTDPRLRTGRRGSPSAMPIIQNEFVYRCQTGNAKATLGEEARELLQWFKENHSLASPPNEHTIRNALRDAYNEYKLKNSR